MSIQINNYKNGEKNNRYKIINKGKEKGNKMIIEQRILDKINAVEGETITENIDILYEFLLDQGYSWIVRGINYTYSSIDLVENIKYIINADISNLDFKYCMNKLEIKSIINEDGEAYYPINPKWYYKMREWAKEKKDKKYAEDKYKRMRKEIVAGTIKYIAI